MPTGYHACMVGKAAAAAGFTIAGAKSHYAPDLSVEPTHIDIVLDLNIPEKSLRAKVTTTVRGSDGASQLILNGIAFDDVTCSGGEHDVTFRYDGEHIDVCWNKEFGVEEERVLVVEYTVSNPISGLLFMTPDEEYPQRDLFVVSDHETERARYWLACVDFPSVRPTYRFHITSAKDHEIVANGVLEGEDDVDGGRKTAHWFLDYPCPSYICCFAVGNLYTLPHEASDLTNIQYLAPKGVDAAHLMRSFGKTPEIMRWMQDKLGVPFPLAKIKYFQIVVPFVNGAMENISLVSWDDKFLLDETLAKDYGHVTESINVHEMAHSYFGNKVVCRHFEHSWLKESWATYFSALWLENQSDDLFRLNMYENAKAYFSECARYTRPIVTRKYNTSWQLFDYHLYPGGTWRVHMLRRVVGDDVFWRAVNEYLVRHSETTVETSDFRRALERASKRNLTRFFDQWIHSAGYPKLKGKFSFDLKSRVATLALEQTQKSTANSIGLFDLDVEVIVVEQCGDAGEVKSHRLRLSMKDGVAVAEGQVTLSAEGKPYQVLIDPDMKLLLELDFNPGVDILRNTMSKGPSINSRIWAADQLIQVGTPSALKSVQQAMQEEPFYGVRMHVAKALAKKKTTLSIDVLASMMVEEVHPIAQMQITGACVFQDRVIRKALLAFLEKDGKCYQSHAFALEAIGEQQHPDDLSTLIQVADQAIGQYHGIVRAGAFRGLAKHGSVEAMDYLGALTPYGAEKEERIRDALVVSYARAASWQDAAVKKIAIRKIVTLLRDPLDRVRKAAVMGLVILKAKARRDEIKAASVTLSNQDQVWVERKLADLNAGGDGAAIKTLEKTVQELQKEVAQLQRDALAHNNSQ
eukprot:TRINITY_DN4640_c0_g1_i1.p1 TRINITY_DN4640_c0_g1~~TRINITY_DN4640_c0_g1_i1.p1  ORF type:complete len:869 (-),score=231.85 TRINITY_DN4640_c0_g1_i1:2242-4827(-)